MLRCDARGIETPLTKISLGLTGKSFQRFVKDVVDRVKEETSLLTLLHADRERS